MNSAFTFIDLFAGAGGLGLGFQRAGFTALAAFDSWEPAVRSYRFFREGEIAGAIAGTATASLHPVRLKGRPVRA
jgi:site-specific DNA-cytosine methylase